jgi:integrase
LKKLDIKCAYIVPKGKCNVPCPLGMSSSGYLTEVPMATIQKRKRATGTVYRVMVRIKGFPEQQKTFSRLTDAKMWAQQTEAAIRKGEFKNVIKTANTKTLQDVIDRYRNDVSPHKAPSTQRAERSYLSFWERELGKYALSYVTPELVSEKIDDLSKAGDGRRKPEDPLKPIRPKSRKTLKHYRDTLNVLFGFAVKWGWTAANPLDGVNKITKANVERVRYLDEDERKRLLDACKTSDNDKLYPIVVFALSTGARKGEILGLTLEDIDLDRGAAILRDTKNGETRPAPIVHHLKDLLKDHIVDIHTFYDGLGDEPSDRWLFPRRDGQAPIDIRKAWENARDSAGIKDFRFHDLRHTTASYLAMNGANPLEIAEVLGHKTFQMVKRYSHLSDSHVKELVQSVNEKMF